MTTIDYFSAVLVGMMIALVLIAAAWKVAVHYTEQRNRRRDEERRAYWDFVQGPDQ